MNAPITSLRESASGERRIVSPIESYLQALHAELSGDARGEVATYIPELGRADPERFAIAIATVDGQVYCVGDAGMGFTLQSISKPFMYGYALREYPKATVLDHVGVEPTGEAFNSIVLDDKKNRPFNPMVNAGAIAVAELMKGEDGAARAAAMLGLMSDFAGRPLDIDETVFRSEQATGHRNRAIAYMMLNSGMITRAPEEVLDLYFRQCAVEVTCIDLAIMAATLANHGVNPTSGVQVLKASHVRDVLTLMNSCGMYNYAGEWAYEVGIPAKSGVSGGIIAVIPGQIGIAVYSPRLDAHGNSVRGVEVCKRISEEFGLHVFNTQTNIRSVIRRMYHGDAVSSKRLRTPEEWGLLKREGRRIAVIELQGALFFGSVERLIRRVGKAARRCDCIIIDFKRVHLVDAAAARLVRRMVRGLLPVSGQIALTHLGHDGPAAALRRKVDEIDHPEQILMFEDTDAALEHFEDLLLAETPRGAHDGRFMLSELDIFRGLSAAELKLIEPEVQAFRFEKGEVIVRAGSRARLFYVVAKGSVSITLPLPGERKKRIASIGPGLTFGEMALLDGGLRSANVVADETVVAYGLSVERVRELSVAHPNILISILGNMARYFSERLRRANEEIAALE